MPQSSLFRIIVASVLVLALAGCSLPSGPVPAATEGETQPPVTLVLTDTPTPRPASVADTPTLQPTSVEVMPTPPPTSQAPAVTPEPAAELDPFDLISLEELFATLEALTAIQPYSGWRNSASQGEAEALDYVAARLATMDALSDMGLALERQSFHVFASTELHETALHLTVDGQEVEVPADGLRGPRDDVAQVLRFDSDGTLNDTQPDPVVGEGPALVVRSPAELNGLSAADVEGRVVLLDYAAVDRSILSTEVALERAAGLIAKKPAGLVLITTFSNGVNESHGAFVGDVSALNWVTEAHNPPILYARHEDVAAAGIEGWEDLDRVAAARLTWDADVQVPGTSGNLVARIPGADDSRAVILGAHIDSPNAPGAMDDGSGSAVLLEVARVLDAARVRPPVDLYLAWFGSEELGLYGGYHFVSTHQALLDRTMAMLQIDCLTRPIDGVGGELRLVAWPDAVMEAGQVTWVDYLADVAAAQGIDAMAAKLYELYSDNAPFIGYDVPNANLIYEPVVGPAMSVHYAGHIHDPYDTVELAREVDGVLEEMARIALAAALQTAQDHERLRTTPPPEHRIVFVASHTEALHMSPATWRDLASAMALEGFDVDLVPYGQAVTPADVADAAIVVALPVHDYPSPEGDLTPYDEAWTEPEVATLEAYVADGGFLILANSAHRLKYGTATLDANEDWRDANTLAGAFGVTYGETPLAEGQALVEADHPLVAGVRSVEMSAGNGLPFTLPAGATVLARAGTDPAVALLDHGAGQVLVLADAATLATGWSERYGTAFWRELAAYVLAR